MLLNSGGSSLKAVLDVRGDAQTLLSRWIESEKSLERGVQRLAGLGIASDGQVEDLAAHIEAIREIVGEMVEQTFRMFAHQRGA